MTTQTLDADDLRRRIAEARTERTKALRLLVMQCRVVAVDEDGLIAAAAAVTSAAVALQQREENLRKWEANHGSK